MGQQEDLPFEMGGAGARRPVEAPRQAVDPAGASLGRPSEERERLSAELEAAAVRALRRDYELLNYNHFRNRLKPPQLLLTDSRAVLGRWSPRDRVLEIARALVLGHPWGVVVEVLKHEMAHQFVHEVLGVTDQTAHGDAFRRTCAALGIDASASGLPAARPGAGGPSAEGDEARVLQRVARLLALADSPNQHEAELAMREAQRLILKHNLEGRATGRPRTYGFRHLGEPTGRLQPHQRMIGTILDAHFFVEVIWVTVHRPLEGKPGTVMEICGTDSNLEMASYVHDFLLRTADSLWRAHKREAGLAADAHRRSYLTGVMNGFHEKLCEQQRQNREAGLVWKGDRDLHDYYDARHPRRRSTHSRMRADPQAYADGKRAGRDIVLHRPIHSGPSGGGSSKKALPARR